MAGQGALDTDLQLTAIELGDTLGKATILWGKSRNLPPSKKNSLHLWRVETIFQK